MSARFAGLPTPRLARMASTALALAAMMACSGETLYDEDDGSGPDGPAVEILVPTGGQVQIGRPVRIVVAAADPLGVASIEITYRGVATGSITKTFSPPRTEAVLDTVVQLTGTTTGELELRAIARNGFNRQGASEAVALQVTRGDEVFPLLTMTTVTPERMELQDSIRVRINAADNPGGSGLARVGLTVLVRSSEFPDTRVFERSTTFNPARPDPVQVDFAFPAPFAEAADVPRDLTLEFFAFAVDSAGNCAAAVGPDVQQLACASYPGREGVIVASTEGVLEETLVVAGMSVNLPTGAVIPDARVDFGRRRLYLSNRDNHRVEVFDIASRAFSGSVAVGSEPWGVELNRNGDTLIVANSGGTNLSYVPLNAGTLQEAVASRVQTPNSVIFTVKRAVDAQLRVRLEATFADFSDRPQFIAQDAFGRLIYSTKPTRAAPDGTVRLAERQPGWVAPEVKLLFSSLHTTQDTTTWTIAHIDSLRVFSAPNANDGIELYDHVPGFPNQLLRSGVLPLLDAIEAMENAGSDIEWRSGILNLEFIGLRDTTYIAASGDRNRIVVGEGSGNPGRVIMWHAPTTTISNELTIADIVGNSSEHITGVAMNQDGTMNVLRGLEGAYFFTQDLRLQGLSATELERAGSGAQLHPNHPSFGAISGTNQLAFVAAGDDIRVVNTLHFTTVGSLPVRDRITGPLRVSPPLPGEAGVVAKIYGVTEAGTLVVVDVRTQDITN